MQNRRAFLQLMASSFALGLMGCGGSGVDPLRAATVTQPFALSGFTTVVSRRTDGSTRCQACIARNSDVIYSVSSSEGGQVVLQRADGSESVLRSSTSDLSGERDYFRDPRLDFSSNLFSWLESPDVLAYRVEGREVQRITAPSGYLWKQNLGITGHAGRLSLFLTVTEPSGADKIGRLDAASGEILLFSFAQMPAGSIRARLDRSCRFGVARVDGPSGQYLIAFRGLNEDSILGTDIEPSSQVLWDGPVLTCAVSSDAHVSFVTPEFTLMTFAPLALATELDPAAGQRLLETPELFQQRPSPPTVVGEAPPVALSSILGGLTPQQISTEVHDALTAQEQQNVDAEAATNQGVATLYGIDDVTTLPVVGVYSPNTGKYAIIDLPGETRFTQNELQSDGNELCLASSSSTAFSIVRFRRIES